ncbi:hypothetical protein B0T22DRAFT_437543 [Podospora appendiculata]|uniref:Uncharacterized protein n=1 Tax=Podospora appendiculata TaxID=314037 RepID=A0AAE0XK81_9PEZI|nr:hypothetical protein B0T22DRAFT_437543 [Podospora appendiculata]
MGLTSFFKITAPASQPAVHKKPQTKAPNKPAQQHTSTPAKPNLSLAPRLSAALLKEVLDRINCCFGHTRYVVGGLAALAAWGFAEDFPTHVTIHCPAGDMEILRTWASASGWVLHPKSRDMLGVPTSDRSVRTVSIKCVSEEAFAHMRSISAAFAREYFGAGIMDTNAHILTLPALLDQFSGLYADVLARSSRAAEDDGPLARSTARLIVWILRRLDNGGWDKPLMAQDVPRVVDLSFWVPFTARYPEAPALFASCGLVDLPLLVDVSEIGHDPQDERGEARHVAEQNREVVYSYDASGPFLYPFGPLSLASARG